MCISVWIEAARPRTLPVSIAPVLVGWALAWQQKSFHWMPALLCLAFALLAQITSNFANDYFDFIRGADTAKRLGPRRAVASGLVSPQAMRRAMLACCAIAFLVGLCLLPFGGWPLLGIGIASLVCAIAYTGGPFPLAYLGLGDVFVFLFFGLIAVGATGFVLTGSWSGRELLAGCALGALATNLLVANNYRDLETDRVAGKRTLVVRFGRGFAKIQFALSHCVAFATPFGLSALGLVPNPWAWLLFLPPGIVSLLLTRALRPQALPSQLIQLLALSSLHVAFYAVCISLWILSCHR